MSVCLSSEGWLRIEVQCLNDLKDYTDESDGNEHRNSQVYHTGVQWNGSTLIQQSS